VTVTNIYHATLRNKLWPLNVLKYNSIKRFTVVINSKVG
jgi:hypothetical protein